MIFDPSSFLPQNPQNHSEGPGIAAWTSWLSAKQARVVPLTVTSRSPLVMDSSSTRNCRSSTFLWRERELSGLCSVRWASPSQQYREVRPQMAQSLRSDHTEGAFLARGHLPRARTSCKPPALPASWPVLHTETMDFPKIGVLNATSLLPRVAVGINEHRVMLVTTLFSSLRGQTRPHGTVGGWEVR